MISNFDFIKRWDEFHCYTHVEPQINYISNEIKNYYKDYPTVYIDIGANVGKVYDILIRNKILNISRAYLFEPCEMLYRYLIDKYYSNNSVRIYNYIISDTISMVNFDDSIIRNDIYHNNSYINFGLSRIVNESSSQMRITHKISDFIIENIINNERMYIKIDTENMDTPIIEDLLSIVSNFIHKPMIEFEINCKNHNRTQAIVERYINELGYTCDKRNTSEWYLIPI
jgi:FkbM family methyltransferase